MGTTLRESSSLIADTKWLASRVEMPRVGNAVQVYGRIANKVMIAIAVVLSWFTAAQAEDPTWAPWMEYRAAVAAANATFAVAVAPIDADTTLTPAQRRARAKPYWAAMFAAYDAAKAKYDAAVARIYAEEE
jgi:hypothetical protein